MQNTITINAAAEFAIKMRKAEMKEIICKPMSPMQNDLLITMLCPLQKEKKQLTALIPYQNRTFEMFMCALCAAGWISTVN